MRRLLLILAALALTACSASAQQPRSTGPPPKADRLSEATTPARPHPHARHHDLTPPSDHRGLRLIKTIGGAISPKSVDATGRGYVFAQNMMYRHTITVYGEHGRLRRTISDGVRLAKYGYRSHPGISHGAPVEAAFDPQRRYAYVSNYSMYGKGFGPEGHDVCSPRSAAQAGVSRSFVYRISLTTLHINGVVRVGRVPKFLAVTPDDRYLLVSNWCSYDLSVVDLHTWKQVKHIRLGTYPRGIAISPDSKRAYVAVMGSSHLAIIDLVRLREIRQITVGPAPRHVVMSPDGRYLYVTLNDAGEVVKVDRRTRRVVRSVATGSEPRSMAIAPDGRSLYVVNYDSDTVTKLRARDLRVLQTVRTGVHPIGITYDPATNDVWVAIYTGKILILADR